MIPLRWLIIGAVALIVFVVGYTLANQFPPPTIRVSPPLTEGQRTRTPTAEQRQVQVMTLTNEAESEPVVFLPLPPVTPSTTATPPAGTIAPAQGFGYVWSQYPDIQPRPGSAIAPEQPYSTRQWIKNGYSGFYDNYDLIGPLYMTLPDGQLVRARIEVMSEGRGWAVIP